jgi:hypothetical protein
MGTGIGRSAHPFTNAVAHRRPYAPAEAGFMSSAPAWTRVPVKPSAAGARTRKFLAKRRPASAGRFASFLWPSRV